MFFGVEPDAIMGEEWSKDMFNLNQMDFMKGLGLNSNFDLLTDSDLVEIEETVGEALQIYGFDKDYLPTDVGDLCESILDQLGEIEG